MKQGKKISEEKIKAINTMFNAGLNYSQIGRKLDLSGKTVSKYITGQTENHSIDNQFINKFNREWFLVVNRINKYYRKPLTRYTGKDSMTWVSKQMTSLGYATKER